jgi:hypothetical protein
VLSASGSKKFPPSFCASPKPGRIFYQIFEITVNFKDWGIGMVLAKAVIIRAKQYE